LSVCLCVCVFVCLCFFFRPFSLSLHTAPPQSTNAHGWPQLALSAYGLDLLGRDVVRGYGCCLVPVTPGRHTRTVPLFRPQSSSPIQQFSAWFMGQVRCFYCRRLHFFFFAAAACS
jgi:hypothetical protein